MEDLARGVPFLARALTVWLEQADLHADAGLWARNLAAAYVHDEQWNEAERFNEEARRLTPAGTGRVLFSTLHAADIAAGRGNDVQAVQLFQQILASRTRTRSCAGQLTMAWRRSPAVLATPVPPRPITTPC